MVIQQHYFRSMGTRVYFAEGKTCWKCTCCFVKSMFCCRCGHKTWLDYMKADDWTALLHSIPFSLIMFGNHDVCISSHLGGEPKHRCYVLVLNKPWWSNRTIWVCPFFSPQSFGWNVSVTICHNMSQWFMTVHDGCSQFSRQICGAALRDAKVQTTWPENSSDFTPLSCSFMYVSM